MTPSPAATSAAAAAASPAASSTPHAPTRRPASSPRPSAGTSAAGTPRRNPPLWLLVLITFSGTLAMHIFVPALPYAATDLGASIADMQQTISLYILGLAAGQLVYGPLSDRFGRRPTLVFGLSLYTLAGLAAALAPQVHALIAARLFQALGGCAGLVLGRAIVRDISTTEESAKRQAMMNLMITAGPGVAPIVGGALASSVGWRSIFVALCGLGLVNLLFTWKLLPETLKAGSGKANPGGLLLDYFRLLRSPAFLGYAIGGGCATTSMYAFVASAPFVFVDQLHQSAHQVGIYLAIAISGIAVGSVIAGRLIGRLPIRVLMLSANALSVAGALVILMAALLHALSVPLLVGAMFAFTVGAGAASPAALTAAISVDRQLVGSASGLYGCAQMVIGALCTSLVGIGHDPALAAGLVLAGAGALAQASFWVAHRARQG